MTDTQLTLLNPTQRDVLKGHMLYDVKGKGAITKIAKRRIDMIDGNVNSYSKVLNSPKRLRLIKEHNDLIAAVAEVSAEVEELKTHRRLLKEQKVPERKEKKQSLATKDV